MDTVLRQDLIDVALRATDAYLGIEKHAKKNGFATQQDIHDFTFYLSKAHDALTQLGDIDNHAEYMQNHVREMARLAGHDDSTLADVPYTHAPQSDSGEVEESYQLDEISMKAKRLYKKRAEAETAMLEPEAEGGEYKEIAQKLLSRRKRGLARVRDIQTEEVEQIDEAAEKGLAAKAAKSGISIATLRKVYARGMAAWRTGHRPGTTPQQWGMARVNSYITKGKTFHTADKDLHEAAEKKISDDELDKMVNALSWEDVDDLFDDEKEEEKEEMQEALSASARLKKSRDFARTGTKRGLARKMQLSRPASMQQLQQRAHVAARRLLAKKFLKGRDRAALSPQEKDLLEQRLNQLQKMGIQGVLAQKLVPKLRQLQQKRLKSR